MRRAASDRGYGWSAKNEMLAQIAGQLGLDYDALCAKWLMYLMSPEQVANLPEDLVDVQLHTHRHRTPLDRARFLDELHETRRVIQDLRPRAQLRHFCYPSGVTHPLFLGWLRETAVTSATTCYVDLATSKADPLMLPRLIDSHNVSDLLFEGWLDGMGAFLPRRRMVVADP